MHYVLKIKGHTAQVWGNNEYAGEDAETTQLIDSLVRQLHPNDAEEVVYSLQKYYNAEVVDRGESVTAS